MTRPERVVIEALDEHGSRYRREAIGLKARAIQHEIDHLDGILFLDHLGLIKRQMLLARWRREHKDDPGYLKEVTAEAAPDRSDADRLLWYPGVRGGLARGAARASGTMSPASSPSPTGRMAAPAPPSCRPRSSWLPRSAGLPVLQPERPAGDVFLASLRRLEPSSAWSWPTDTSCGAEVLAVPPAA